MSEQERKQQRICDLLNAETEKNNFRNNWSFFLWPPSSAELNIPDYDRGSVLENKTHATSHSNIGSLKTASGEEWNKISEEFILRTCKLFWRYVDTIIEKHGAHIE